MVQIKRTKTNSTLVQGTRNEFRLGTQIKKKTFTRSNKSYCQIWRVLDFLHDLLNQNKTVTQRELYYCMINDFANQTELNTTIQDIVALLAVPRRSLGIVTTSKGLMKGVVEILDTNGKWINCVNLPGSGYMISGDSESIKEVKSKTAKFILVVEKDSIYERLVEDEIYLILPCIIITAKGFPDLATRSLLKRLQETLNIPILGLFDWNVGGIQIFFNYKYGSVNMGLESYKYNVDIHWLGLVSKDLETVDLPLNCYQPTTENDQKKIQNLLKRTDLMDGNVLIKNELMKMVELKVKVELQAFNTFGYGFLPKHVISAMIKWKFNK